VTWKTEADYYKKIVMPIHPFASEKEAQEVARVANELHFSVPHVQRAIEYGALVPDADGTFSDAELEAFVTKKFKNHRYDENGNKLPGVKS
jgi:hypothetical protein